MLERFKKKWEIDSNLKIVLILFVFAITGFSAVFVKDMFFRLIGINEQTPFYLRTIFYIVILFPSYQVLLNFYALLFGQFKFFWRFQKKTFQRFSFKRNSENQ
jgi:hypothetical protein